MQLKSTRECHCDACLQIPLLLVRLLSAVNVHIVN